MPGTRPTRRTVLGTFCSIVAGLLTAPSTDAIGTATVGRSGIDVGVVDRIVDGEHVVILLEDGDEVVDQVVVSHETYPCLEERDTVLVTLADGEARRIRPLEDSP